MNAVWLLRRNEIGSSVGTFNFGVYATLEAAQEAARRNVAPRPNDTVRLTWRESLRPEVWTTDPVRVATWGRAEVWFRAERFEVAGGAA